jgi:hypothetical protein
MERQPGKFEQCTNDNLSHVNIADIPAPLRGRKDTIRFLMPLAHVICDANKSRSMIGFLTVDNFASRKIPEPDTWFKPADFYDNESRNQQANDIDGKDVASIFIRFESGHSNNITIAHTPFRPVAFQNPYLVHGTNEKNLQMPTKTLLTQLIPHVLLMEEQV